MKSMDTWRQRCAVVVGLTVASVLTLTPAAAGKPKSDDTVMDMTFSGTFFNSPSLNIGHFIGKGSPGKATSRFVGIPAGPGIPPDFPSECCDAVFPDGSPACLLAHNGQNPLVFTFEDLSLLFANINEDAEGNVIPGDLCVDLTTGRVEFRIEIMFTGGRGRFEGATGEAVITGEVEPVSPDGTFSGETGRIVGTIVLP